MTSIQTAVETVQAYDTALTHGDLDGVLTVVAPDAVLEEPDFLPYAGIYRGHEAWRQ